MSIPTPTACRSCGSKALHRFAERDDAVFCAGCCLLQRLPSPGEVATACPPRPSTSRTDGASLARRIIEARGLGAESLVVEIGSGEGDLLRHYRDRGIPVLGIEANREMARVARQQHLILTRDATFCRSIADRLRIQGLRCDLLHAHDMIEHAADLNDFVRGVRLVLKDDGVALIDTHSVTHLIDSSIDPLSGGREYCFSLTSLSRCLTARGLVIADADRHPEDSSLMRLQVVPALAGVRWGERVSAMLAGEQSWGVEDVSRYAPSRLIDAA
jgi:SAM-dependent methyltransferase